MLVHRCRTCAAVFTKPHNPLRHYSFCSYKCRAHSQKAVKPTSECDYCGDTFSAWPGELQGGRRFCSPRCGNANKDQGKTTEAFRLRTSRAYAAWREGVFRRDDFTCQLCGKRGGKLHADHIKRFADFPELRLAETNGRTLCAECHFATPTFGNRRQLVVQEA